MATKFKKFLVGLITSILTFTGLVAAESPSYALNASTFDPGLIISDSVFYDWGTMNADAIQKFLNARVSSCSNNRGETCIRDYKEDVVGSYAIRGGLHNYDLHVCADIPAAKNQTAATIIYKVAVACRINPRVLLVTLQKEQGLIGSGNPSTYMYKAAMGYGCPDSAPQVCGQDSNANSRLFWQLYRASWQLRWYGDPRGGFTYLKPNTTISMGYHPNSSCGRKTFKLKSQATANLYYYTPYTPNTAALNNLWGTGDSCSAYGNRNFWRQFWTWFGSPVSGGYLIKSSTSDTYLVNSSTNKRYLINDQALIDAFKPLGPLGTVSESYMASFADAGQLQSFVKDQDDNHYLIASGNKYPVLNEAQATVLGLDWASASELTDVQLSSFGDLAFGQSATTNEVFLLQGTNRTLVRDASLIKQLSAIGGTAVMPDTMLEKFTLLPPITSLVQDSSGVRYDIADGFKLPVASQALAASLGHTWNSATTIATSQLAKLPTAAFIKAANTSTVYFLTEGTKHQVTAAQLSSISKFGGTAEVSADYLTKYTSGAPLTNLLKTSTDVWYYSGSLKYKVNQAQATALGQDYTKALTVSSTQLANLRSPLLMKNSTSGAVYLVDDWLNKHPIDSADLANYSGLGAAGSIAPAYLATFTTKTDPDRFVKCSTDGLSYFLYGSKRYLINSATMAKHIAPATFGTATDFSVLPTLTSTQLAGFTVANSNANPVTNYVKETDGSTYLIENGQRRQVLDSASLAAAVNSVPSVSPLSASKFSNLALGNPIIAEGTIFKNSSSGKYGAYVGGTFYELTDSLYSEVKAAPTWHFTNSSGSLTAASVGKLTQGTAVTPFVISNNSGYLLGATGKQALTDIRNIVASPTTLPTAFMNKIDASPTAAFATPFLVKSADSKSPTYLVSNKFKRKFVDASEAAAALPMVNGAAVQVWSQSAIDAIVSSTNVVAPGTIIKVKESGNLYLLDGWAKGLRLTSTMAAAFGSTTPKVVTRADLTGYNTASALPWQKVVCGSATYLADGGKLLKLDDTAIAAWPSTATTLDSKTCQRLVPTDTRVGVFVSVGTKKYKVIEGKLKRIRTTAEYTAMLGNLTPAVPVSQALIDELPKLNPTSYVVVSGDTLYKVAVKFKTTRATLRTLNHLTTDVLTKGQVLILP